MTPMEAALQGRRRDRLHHRLDQRLADRGVHPAAADGRHRRPAVPRIRRDRDDGRRGLGVRVADADADDVLALPARRAQGPHGRLYRLLERCLRRHARRATAAAGRRAAPPASHHAAGVPAPPWRSPSSCTSSSPRASSRSRTPASSIGIAEAAQDISFAGDGRAPAALTDILSQGPGRRPLTRPSVGGTTTYQHGALLHQPEARDAAQVQRRRDHRPPAPRSWRRSRACAVFCRRRQDIRVGGRWRAPSISTPCRTPTSTSSIPVGAEDAGQAESAAAAARRRHRPADAGATATLTIDRDQASRFGIRRS